MMNTMIKTIMILVLVLLGGHSFAGRWVCGDMHNHTATSYDCNGGTAMSSMSDAVDAGYNFIIITDHNEWGEWTNGNVPEANRQHGDRDRRPNPARL